MSEDSGSTYERSKLKKQLTQRKRGKTPTAASEAEEEKKSEKSTATKSSFVKKSALQKELAKYLPSCIVQPSKGNLFDIAFFACAAIVIYKFGNQMNDTIRDIVPTEATLRQ